MANASGHQSNRELRTLKHVRQMHLRILKIMEAFWRCLEDDKHDTVSLYAFSKSIDSCRKKGLELYSQIFTSQEVTKTILLSWASFCETALMDPKAADRAMRQVEILQVVQEAQAHARSSGLQQRTKLGFTNEDFTASVRNNSGYARTIPVLKKLGGLWTLLIFGTITASFAMFWAYNRDLEAYAERLPAMGSIGSLMQDCMLAVQSDNMTNQTLGNLSSNLVCSFGSDCLVTH
jgi:hypothetical protein